MRLRTLSSILLAISLFAAGPLMAQSPAGSDLPAKLSKLEDVDLRLVKFRSYGTEIVIPSGTAITLTFRKQGQLSGRSAVNNYAGRFTAQSNGAIAIQLATSTQMAGPPELMKLEREYFDALSHVKQVHLNSDQVILGSETTSLTFTSSRSK